MSPLSDAQLVVVIVLLWVIVIWVGIYRLALYWFG